MKSLILCEGFDDVLILGYYLHKTHGWMYSPNADFSSLYQFPKVDKKRETIEIYKRQDDLLGIWCVGGKDSFDHAYQFINTINTLHPEDTIQNLFLVMDRDANELHSVLASIVCKMNQYDFSISTLENHKKTIYEYTIDEEVFKLNIIPVIIPFDSDGALETVLMEGIAEAGDEESYIVNCANSYIDSLLSSGKLKKYLNRERKILKAKLSAVISVTNPDRSTNEFDKVLLSWDWECAPAVKKHFGVITNYLL